MKAYSYNVDGIRLTNGYFIYPYIGAKCECCAKKFKEGGEVLCWAGVNEDWFLHPLCFVRTATSLFADGSGPRPPGGNKGLLIEAILQDAYDYWRSIRE